MNIKPIRIRPLTLRQRRGFTLVELLLVLTIMSLLAAIVYPKIIHHGLYARRSAAYVQIKAFDSALETFAVDNGYFPKGQNGLQELVQRPAGAQRWHGPYLAQIPQDPWQNAYIYTFPGKHNPETYDLVSMGQDGQLGTADDITNLQPPK